jgi:hypothetical protein
MAPDTSSVQAHDLHFSRLPACPDDPKHRRCPTPSTIQRHPGPRNPIRDFIHKNSLTHLREARLRHHHLIDTGAASDMNDLLAPAMQYGTSVLGIGTR